MSFSALCKNPESISSFGIFIDDPNLIAVLDPDGHVHCFTRKEMFNLIDSYGMGADQIRPIIMRSPDDVPGLDPMDPIQIYIDNYMRQMRENKANWHYFLSSMFMIDSSFKDCIDAKCNTIRLIRKFPQPIALISSHEQSGLQGDFIVYTADCISRCSLFPSDDEQKNCFENEPVGHFNDDEKETEIREIEVEEFKYIREEDPRVVEVRRNRQARNEAIENGTPYVEINGDMKHETLFKRNGLVQVEKWFQNDVLHRDGNDPAMIIYYYYNVGEGDVNTIEFKEIRWYKNGQLGRSYVDDEGDIIDADEPSILIYEYKRYTPNVLYVAWYKDGKLHRDNESLNKDSAAVITRLKEGFIPLYNDVEYHSVNVEDGDWITPNTTKYWFQNGVAYREGQKAPCISFEAKTQDDVDAGDNNDLIASKTWSPHERNDGLTSIEYSTQGKIHQKVYTTKKGSRKPFLVIYSRNTLIHEKRYEYEEYRDDGFEEKTEYGLGLEKIIFDETGKVEDVKFVARENAAVAYRYKFYANGIISEEKITFNSRPLVFLESNRDIPYLRDLPRDTPYLKTYYDTGELKSTIIASPIYDENQAGIVDDDDYEFTKFKTTMYYKSGNLKAEFETQTSMPVFPAGPIVIYYDKPEPIIKVRLYAEREDSIDEIIVNDSKGSPLYKILKVDNELLRITKTNTDGYIDIHRFDDEMEVSMFLYVRDFSSMNNEEWYPKSLEDIFKHTPLPEEKVERKEKEVKEQQTSFASLGLTEDDINPIDPNYWRDDNETMAKRTNITGNINEYKDNLKYFNFDESLDSTLYVEDDLPVLPAMIFNPNNVQHIDGDVFDAEFIDLNQ